MSHNENDKLIDNEIDFKLKPIADTDSPEVKAIKYNWEMQNFILNEMFKK